MINSNSFINCGYYLPHHCILSPESTTTKLRVVVSEADRKYQLIYWRWNSNETLKTYALKTVTYGTASDSYLAVKLERKNFPVESNAIRNDFYMVDLMTGGDGLESVRLLLDFGMPLRKWCANEECLLQGLDPSQIEGDLNIDSNNLKSVKTLGVIWNPISDKLSLKYSLIGPVTVTTKIMLQDLWKLKLDWDDKVPEQMTENFKFLNEVNIPRHIICVNFKRSLIGPVTVTTKIDARIVSQYL
ncbi:hypothetical protein CVS40_11833 [Lucilia cuprina]|nr:hypothetical protein CVS40_11833 [Lucilia cuprina]